MAPPGSGFFGSTGWAVGDGSPVPRNGNLPPDLRRPNPPRQLNVTVTGDFAITVTFQDTSVSVTNQAHPIPVALWQIRACSVSAAGSPDATVFPPWRDRVLAKSRVLSTEGSAGAGDIISVSITDPTLLDCYIQVVGISTESVQGIPTEPLLVFASGLFPPGNLDDVFNQAVNLVAFTDEYGVAFVDVNPIYTGPLILGRFYGISIYAVGYLGSSDLVELGNLLLYEQNIGGKVQRNKLRLPKDVAMTSTTLYWVSVDRAGVRRDDITSAPSTALATGIFA